MKEPNDHVGVIQDEGTEKGSDGNGIDTGGKKGLDRKQKISLVAIVLGILLLAAGVGVAIALHGGVTKDAAPKTEQEAPKAVPAAKAEIELTLIAEGGEDAAVKAICSVKYTDTVHMEEIFSESKTISPKEVPANEKTVIGELEPGHYRLSILSAPILEDGSTYKLPDEPYAFTVKDDGKTVEIEIELGEKLAVEDMTKEQLEAVAVSLADNGYDDAAKTVQERAQTAPSVEGSGDVVKQEAPANNNGSSNNGGSNNGSGNTPAPAPAPAPNPGNSGGSNNGGNTPAPADPNPKTWHEAVTEQRWIVDQPAWTEQVAVYGSEERSICNNCGADITGNTTAHTKEHFLAGEGGGYHSEVVTVITGYNTIEHPEQGHYETVVIKEAGWY